MTDANSDDHDEAQAALLKKATSKRVTDKTLIRFSKRKPLTKKKAPTMAAVVLPQRLAAAALFEVSQSMFPPDFETYMENNPIDSEVVRLAIEIALYTESPSQKAQNALRGHELIYGAAKRKALARWTEVQTSPTPPTKRRFLDEMCQDIADTNGKVVTPETIEKWLPKRK